MYVAPYTSAVNLRADVHRRCDDDEAVDMIGSINWGD
jgi:hypothetical protein